MSENDPAYSYAADSPNEFEAEVDELSWDDIQRLTCGFIVCILGTAAHKGSIFWTLIFFASIGAMGLWWAADKTDNLYQSFTKKKNMNQKYQFHDEF